MVVAILIAKLIDPLVAILAGVAGACSRQWWHIAVIAGVVGVIDEIALSAIQHLRTFSFPVFLIGVLAAGVWGAIGLLAGRRLRRPAPPKEREDYSGSI